MVHFDPKEDAWVIVPEEMEFYSNYHWSSSLEEEEFHSDQDWLSESMRELALTPTETESTSPTMPVSASIKQAFESHSTVNGEFYYRNMHFDSVALTLVVCCAIHGVYTAADTAFVLSQQQQELHEFDDFEATAEDVLAVLQKVQRENSAAYQYLQSEDAENSILVRAVLQPMVVEGCVCMKVLLTGDGHEVPPRWYPSLTRRRIPREVSVCKIRSNWAENVRKEDSTQIHSEPAEEVN